MGAADLEGIRSASSFPHTALTAAASCPANRTVKSLMSTSINIPLKVQAPRRLGQNKFLSTVLPIHFFLDLERWDQAFHSVSMSISLLIYFLAAQ